MTGDDRAAAVAEALADWLDRDDVGENRAADEVRSRADEAGHAILAALDAQPGDTEQAGGLTEDERCVNCGHRLMVHSGGQSIVHAEGPQEGKGTCALYPYGIAQATARAAAAPGVDTVQARCWRSECRNACYYPDCCSEVRAATGTTAAPTPSHKQTCPGPHDHMARCWNAGAAARAGS